MPKPGRRNKRNGQRPNNIQGAINKVSRFSYDGCGFPPRLLAKLRYHTNAFVTSTTGGVGRYFFRLNSIFDPDVTSTGHQPLYSDEFQNLYDHYSVVKSSAVVRFTNASTGTWVCGTVIEDDTASSTSLDTLSEMTTTRHSYLTPQTGSHSNAVIEKKWDCMAMLGIDPFTSEAYKTAFGSNPSEEQCLVVYAATADSSTNDLLFDVTIEYEVLFTELKTPVGS